MEFTRNSIFGRGGALALAVALSVALAACSGTSQAPESTENNATSTSAQATPIVHRVTFTPFHDSIPVALTNKQCALDEINGQPATSAGAIASGSTVIFGGWAGSGQGQPAEQVALVLKGAQDSYSAPITADVTRPDVARVLNSAGMAKSGYNISATLIGVAAGTYSLYVANPANPAADCDLQRTLVVR